MVDLRELGWKCGNYETGKTNSIIDVPDVQVGHFTLVSGNGKLIPGKGPIRTGVSVIIPHRGNCYKEKCPAGIFIANGFGKATGISQILETGYLESPIAITNTLNVGLVYDALITYAISKNPDIGIKTGSVSPIVAECFDGYLNDIQGRHVKEHHVLSALKDAENTDMVEQGSIGAGTGMQVFQLKSGVGTSSRVLYSSDQDIYHIGVLTVPNFGKFNDFCFYGYEMASLLDNNKYLPQESEKDNLNNSGGSIIAIIATDLPLNSRQLNRIARRGFLGIARTGSVLHHSSGDFIFSFSTTNRLSNYKKQTLNNKVLNESSLLFTNICRAVVESVQESIYNAMLTATTMKGRDNHVRVALDSNDLPKSK